MSALQAENSMLKAENYSDKNAKEVYMQSLTDNRRLRDETFAYLKPLSDEAANNRVELANEGIVTGKWTPEVVQFNS